MDPITLIVTAVALGASAGLKDSAAQMVKDAYAGLKALLARRQIDVTPIERRPDSASKRESLSEDLKDLADTPDAVDDELLIFARRVVEAVKSTDSAAAAAIGIDLEKLEAESLRIGGVSASGTGIRGKDWRISGDAVIENVHAGSDRRNDEVAESAEGRRRYP